ncbi:MAG: HEAT repeat domain-containing protein [Planctomycetota bacterium]|nr:HEAT repeat domain-containing protein [Planctomycetota bacterium]
MATAAVLFLLVCSPEASKVDFRGGVAKRLRLLRHDSPAVRQRAARLLGHAHPDEVLAGLLVALKDPAPGVRREVAQALQRLSDERAVPFLANRTRVETSPPVLAHLLIALGRCGGAYVGGRITPFLEHPRRSVRTAAAAALGHVGDAGQRDAMWAALRYAPDDPRFVVRSALLTSFVTLQWKKDVSKAIDELIEAGARRHWASRASIASSIGAAGLRGRAEYVRKEVHADDDPRVVAAAAGALARLGHEDEVFRLLQHPTAVVRRAALVALHDVRDPRGVQEALRLIRQDPDVHVRFEAVLVLDAERHPEADTYLLDALTSRNPLFWMSAVQALERRHGRALGRDVEAWKAFLKETPHPPAGTQR